MREQAEKNDPIIRKRKFTDFGARTGLISIKNR